MNTRLLRKVAKHISEEPKRFVMGSFALFAESETHVYEAELVDGKDEWKFPECGTAACIAGWACILSNDPHPHDYADAARRLLDIDYRGGGRLFSIHDWPYQFYERFINAKTIRGRVNAAVARIEHFIKTKGKE